MLSLLGNWQLRAIALPPQAVVARGADALALARRLLDRTDKELGALHGAISRENSVLAIRGDFELLPWWEGARFLGGDEAAALLLWPIHLEPPCAPQLLERALRREFPGLSAPLALVPDWKMVLPLGEALPVRRDFVARFLESF